jgi:hypothetical protein
MEELVSRVSERAGISEEQARTAVETVAGFLKERIPAPYNNYVDSFMGSGGGDGGGGGGIGGMLGNLFGKKE